MEKIDDSRDNVKLLSWARVYRGDRYRRSERGLGEIYKATSILLLMNLLAALR